jgi:hypothetical protein
MTSTTVFHNLTAARAERTGPGEVLLTCTDDQGSRVTFILKTVAQADALAKAGFAAAVLLGEDGAPPPAECGPGVCVCGEHVDKNGGVHQAGETS